MSASESRRASVLRIYDALSAGSLPEDGGVLAEVFAAGCRHHSAQTLSEGPGGASQLYRSLQDRLPGVVATPKRSASDGDLVGVHWHASTDPGDELSGESWCEFFRFDGDRVVEHWQLHVPVPASTVSGRSVFSDAYEPASANATGEDLTEVNRDVATAAFARFLEFDHTVVADHWGEVYLQHNELIPDGTDALRESLAEVGGLPAEMRPAFTVLLTVAEGDLVWFLERVQVGDETGLGADIFRLADRRIVEHWDVPAMRPPGLDAH